MLRTEKGRRKGTESAQRDKPLIALRDWVLSHWAHFSVLRFIFVPTSTKPLIISSTVASYRTDRRISFATC